MKCNEFRKIVAIVFIISITLHGVAYAGLVAHCTDPDKTIQGVIPRFGEDHVGWHLEITNYQPSQAYTVWYRIRWLSGPAGSNVPPGPPIGIQPLMQIVPPPPHPPSSEVPLMLPPAFINDITFIIIKPNAVPGDYVVEIDVCDVADPTCATPLATVDPGIKLSEDAFPVGYNITWLIVTTFSLVLVGGYLILRRRALYGER